MSKLHKKIWSLRPNLRNSEKSSSSLSQEKNSLKERVLKGCSTLRHSLRINFKTCNRQYRHLSKNAETCKAKHRNRWVIMLFFSWKRRIALENWRREMERGIASNPLWWPFLQHSTTLTSSKRIPSLLYLQLTSSSSVYHPRTRWRAMWSLQLSWNFISRASKWWTLLLAWSALSASGSSLQHNSMTISSPVREESPTSVA